PTVVLRELLYCSESLSQVESTHDIDEALSPLLCAARSQTITVDHLPGLPELPELQESGVSAETPKGDTRKLPRGIALPYASCSSSNDFQILDLEVVPDYLKACCSRGV